MINAEIEFYDAEEVATPDWSVLNELREEEFSTVVPLFDRASAEALQRKVQGIDENNARSLVSLARKPYGLTGKPTVAIAHTRYGIMGWGYSAPGVIVTQVHNAATQQNNYVPVPGLVIPEIAVKDHRKCQGLEYRIGKSLVDRFLATQPQPEVGEGLVKAPEIPVLADLFADTDIDIDMRIFVHFLALGFSPISQELTEPEKGRAERRVGMLHPSARNLSAALAQRLQEA